MKLAVCISGQPRTFETAYPSILNYFGSPDDVDYFCHTWDYNNWKITDSSTGEKLYSVDEQVDRTRVSEMIQDVLKPKAFQIETSDDLERLQGYRWSWDSMFYSIRRADEYRRLYSIQNGVWHRAVVKTRYDVGFKPGSRFEFLNYRPRSVFFRFIDRMPEEYWKLNASDVCFFGDPAGMSIATDYHVRAMQDEKLSRTPSRMSPGVRLYEYLAETGVEIGTHTLADTIIRPEAAAYDVITEWDKIKKVHDGYYK